MLALYGPAAPATEAADFAAIAAPTDFLGLNYYNPSFVRDAPAAAPLRVGHVRLPEPEYAYTAMGWVVYPKGLEDLLRRLPADYPTGPLYITENGAAYPDPPPLDGRVPDPERVAYYAQHLAAARRAIAAGVDLRGYFAWSLMDNFEWAFGYSKRFGLAYVDYATQRRTVKDSGRWYSRVVAEGRLPPAPGE